jgi:hypothetical protein
MKVGLHWRRFYRALPQKFRAWDLDMTEASQRIPKFFALRKVFLLKLAHS